MITKIIRTTGQAAAGLMALAALFVLVEPAISQGAVVEDQFTVSQTITSEISFLTNAADVVMAPTLGGITGGTSVGSTYVKVFTNNATGYTMTLKASSSLGMIGNASSSNYIPAYATSSTFAADYNFNVPANKAYFGYTIQASTTADAAPAFKYTGTTCNTGSTNDGAHCWVGATTTPFIIINRSLQTPVSGATTTINFQVTINSNPSPAIPNDTYVATTTLTATTN